MSTAALREEIHGAVVSMSPEEAVARAQNLAAEHGRPLPETHTSAELLAMAFPEPIWLVPGIIPEGLTLLAGAPKVGKSWLALQLAAALSVGGTVLGSIAVKRQPVLYLALEDRPRRLQNRMKALGVSPSPDFHYVTEWRRGTEGIEDLAYWLDLHPAVGVVVVDVLERIRGSRGNQGAYEADYLALSALKTMADRRSVSVVVLHHDRKLEAGDWLDSVSGSKGLTGAADTVLLLKKRLRREAQAELSVTGRDVEDAEHALSFQEGVGWVLLGDAREYRCTKERREIVEAMRAAREPIAPKELAERLGKNASTVKTLLFRLLDEGVIEKAAAYGRYRLPCTPSSLSSPSSPGAPPVGCSPSSETTKTTKTTESTETTETTREREEEREGDLWEGADLDSPPPEPEVVPDDIF